MCGLVDAWKQQFPAVLTDSGEAVSEARVLERCLQPGGLWSGRRAHWGGVVGGILRRRKGGRLPMCRSGSILRWCKGRLKDRHGQVLFDNVRLELIPEAGASLLGMLGFTRFLFRGRRRE